MSVEGNALVCQMNSVCRIPGERGAEVRRTSGPGFGQKGSGVEGREPRGSLICA